MREVSRRFFAGKDATACAAWEGRFRGAVDRDGRTWHEVGDALEDLMATKPQAEWTPVVFRAYLGRLRRSIAAEASRDTSAQQAGERATAEANVPRGTLARRKAGLTERVAAADAFAEVRGLITEENTQGSGTVHFIRPADLEQLGPAYVATVRRVGGVRRIIADVVKHPERIGLLLKDWTEVWDSPTPATQKEA